MIFVAAESIEHRGEDRIPHRARIAAIRFAIDFELDAGRPRAMYRGEFHGKKSAAPAQQGVEFVREASAAVGRNIVYRAQNRLAAAQRRIGLGEFRGAFANPDFKVLFVRGKRFLGQATLLGLVAIECLR